MTEISLEWFNIGTLLKRVCLLRYKNQTIAMTSVILLNYFVTRENPPLQTN